MEKSKQNFHLVGYDDDEFLDTTLPDDLNRFRQSGIVEAFKRIKATNSVFKLSTRIANKLNTTTVNKANIYCQNSNVFDSTMEHQCVCQLDIL